MAQKGDFIGFTFNDTHSSDLGIVRTSNGSRYNSSLLPSSSDQTVAVPGGDGVYFFGTNYQTRVFQLQIASDEISEVRMKDIKIWLGDKQIHELIFDETPYKVYMAKCTNMPQFNFICFNENGERIYKGEGSIEFTCYYPYAKSRYKFLNQYTHKDTYDQYDNVPEWNNNEFILQNGTLHNHYLLPSSFTNVTNLAGTKWRLNDTIEVTQTYLVAQLDFIDVNGAEYTSINITNALAYLPSNEAPVLCYTAAGQWANEAYRIITISGGQTTYQPLINWLKTNAVQIPITVDLKNLDEWAIASGMRLNQGTLDNVPSNKVYVYNPGDIEADFQVWIEPGNARGIQYYFDNQRTDNKHLLEFDFSSLDFTHPEDLYYIQYDSKTELLTGYTSINNDIGEPNGKLYNKYITRGDFFKIPVNINLAQNVQLISNSNPITGTIKKIEYNYLYY